MPNALVAKPQQKPISLSSYTTLRSKVQAIFLTGQKKINETKAKTYWKAGKAINDLVGRAHTPYLSKGKHVVAGLAKDLNIATDLLYKCMQFAEQEAHFSTSRNVDWSHYAELLSIEDPALRAKLLEKTSKENWPVKKLREEIKNQVERKKAKVKPGTLNFKPSTVFLKPRLGKLHTYRVVGNPEFGLKDTGELFFDHGFRFYSSLSEKGSFGIVEIQKGNVISSSRIDKDRYFYSAKVEKGIDGDTFWTVIDAGLEQITEQKLRLRGINAAEVGTYGAKKATKFLEAFLPPGSEILLKTSPSPNHDRFVADVFVTVSEARQRQVLTRSTSAPDLDCFVTIETIQYYFLNNLLLALGLAKRMEE